MPQNAAGTQEAAAADDDAVVARIAQRHRSGGRRRIEIGAHAAEAAGMLVGVEQHVQRAARQPLSAKWRATWARMATPALELAAPRPSSRPPVHGAGERRLAPLARSPAGAVSMQASRQSTGPGAAPAISTRTATACPRVRQQARIRGGSRASQE